MNIVLWVLQGLLAFGMVGAGMMKLVTPKATLDEKMGWPKTWPAGRVKLLGLAEVLGAVGVIGPWATGLVPVLTPIAAVCLAILMAGAVKTHVDLKDGKTAPAAVLFAIALLVAVGRSGLLKF